MTTNRGSKASGKRVRFPRVGPDNEWLHRFQRAQHGLHVGAAAALTPSDQAIVGSCLHDNVHHPIAINPGTCFTMCVGNVDRNKFQIRILIRIRLFATRFGLGVVTGRQAEILRPDLCAVDHVEIFRRARELRAPILDVQRRNDAITPRFPQPEIRGQVHPLERDFR